MKRETQEESERATLIEEESKRRMWSGGNTNRERDGERGAVKGERERERGAVKGEVIDEP